MLKWPLYTAKCKGFHITVSFGSKLTASRFPPFSLMTFRAFISFRSSTARWKPLIWTTWLSKGDINFVKLFIMLVWFYCVEGCEYIFWRISTYTCTHCGAGTWLLWPTPSRVLERFMFELALLLKLSFDPSFLLLPPELSLRAPPLWSFPGTPSSNSR